MPRHPDTVVTPNTLLSEARQNLPSPQRARQYMSRGELADAVNTALDRLYPGRDISAHYVYRTWIGKLERGEHRWPSEERRAALRDVLRVATDTELGLYSPRRTDDPLPLAAHGRLPDVEHAVPFEDPAVILQRIQEHAPALTEARLDELDSYVATIVEEYEHRGPGRLAPALVRQRQQIQPLLGGWYQALQRDRLFRIAGQMSGQLSYMATNLGNFAAARAYGIEAFALAGEAQDDDLRAWIRGTQSLVEYYAGEYSEALRLARDGRRYAGRGRQAVRLAVNGEARALGKLGEHRAADTAIGEAYQLLDTLDQPGGMTPCISFDLYSEARTAANAVTSYVALTQPAKALSYAGRVLEVVDTSTSVWSRSLVRLDMAAAVIAAPQPDLEHATALMRAAMAAADKHRIESIVQRTTSLAGDLSAWAAVPVVADLLEEVAHWLSNGSSSRDAT